MQELRELHHASGCEHEGHSCTTQDVDELVVLGWRDVVHFGVGAGNEHLLALLNERREDVRSNWHGYRGRIGARQVVRSVRHNFIQHKWTGNAVHCTDAELLQI